MHSKARALVLTFLVAAAALSFSAGVASTSIDNTNSNIPAAASPTGSAPTAPRNADIGVTQSAPVVVWASSPVLPNQTALLRTAALAGSELPLSRSLLRGAGPPSVHICPGNATSVDPGTCSATPLQQEWNQGFMFSVPASQALDVWSIFAGGNDTTSHHAASTPESSAAVEIARLNEAEGWWFLCERSDSGGAEASGGRSCFSSQPTPKSPAATAPSAVALVAAPQSKLRVIGRSLSFDLALQACRQYSNNNTTNNGSASGAGTAFARLTPVVHQADVHSPVDSVELVAESASCYEAMFVLPSATVLPPGTYSVELKNNLPHSSFSPLLRALSTEQTLLQVDQSPKWPAGLVRTVIPGNVTDLKLALAEAGPTTNHTNGTASNGTVFLPAGEWIFGTLDRIEVPDGVTLRGVSARSTILRWPQQTGLFIVHFDRRVGHFAHKPQRKALCFLFKWQ